MFQMDFKARFRNKAFLIALASAIVLLLKNCGFGNYIPQNWDIVLNSLISIGILLGVITDTSTAGFSDVIPETTVQAINQAAVSENSQVANTDLSNSASSKIMVDVPEE